MSLTWKSVRIRDEARGNESNVDERLHLVAQGTLTIRILARDLACCCLDDASIDTNRFTTQQTRRTTTSTTPVTYNSRKDQGYSSNRIAENSDALPRDFVAGYIRSPDHGRARGQWVTRRQWSRDADSRSWRGVAASDSKCGAKQHVTASMAGRGMWSLWITYRGFSSTLVSSYNSASPPTHKYYIVLFALIIVFLSYFM